MLISINHTVLITTANAIRPKKLTFTIHLRSNPIAPWDAVPEPWQMIGCCSGSYTRGRQIPNRWAKSNRMKPLAACLSSAAALWCVAQSRSWAEWVDLL